jgi:hypothetical protein
LLAARELPQLVMDDPEQVDLSLVVLVLVLVQCGKEQSF